LAIGTTLACKNIIKVFNNIDNVEYTEIIIYRASGEKVIYTNPDWYKLDKNGITFEKDGKQIRTGGNYEVIIHLEDE